MCFVLVHVSFLLIHLASLRLFFFFFNDTATTEIYTLSLHDALPIYQGARPAGVGGDAGGPCLSRAGVRREHGVRVRSEEHTSELQSQSNLVCRLLLEKKKNKDNNNHADREKEAMSTV